MGAANFDIASANVGDVVALVDGRTVTIEGICISLVTGNSVLVGGEWLADGQVVGTIS